MDAEQKLMQPVVSVVPMNNPGAARMAAQEVPQGLYVFVVQDINMEVVGVFGSRMDADNLALTKAGTGAKKHFYGENNWSWCGEGGECFVAMEKVQ